ncbi:hypothetical protein RRG08_011167 [Elysia crispata]|uniref:Uncharacterized protein n=1 Tax=Elysia crispata TaxID=231223 RepID=A0AAE1DQI5_9GAST|nr:hypothetical protein RRG08_011167 [Elysia crispata]
MVKHQLESIHRLSGATGPHNDTLGGASASCPDRLVPGRTMVGLAADKIPTLFKQLPLMSDEFLESPYVGQELFRGRIVFRGRTQSQWSLPVDSDHFAYRLSSQKDTTWVNIGRWIQEFDSDTLDRSGDHQASSVWLAVRWWTRGPLVIGSIRPASCPHDTETAESGILTTMKLGSPMFQLIFLYCYDHINKKHK